MTYFKAAGNSDFIFNFSSSLIAGSVTRFGEISPTCRNLKYSFGS